MFGEIWSPDTSTDTYYLVKVSEALNQYALGEISESELNEALNNNLKLLNISKKKTSPLEYLSSKFKSKEPYLHCNTEEFVPLVAHLSIGIQELAMDKDISEHNVSAIL